MTNSEWTEVSINWPEYVMDRIELERKFTKWLQDKGISDYHFSETSTDWLFRYNDTTIFFEREEDAVLFALRWS
jgi:hypothetical protein